MRGKFFLLLTMLMMLVSPAGAYSSYSETIVVGYSEDADYSDLQEAIDAAQSGALIFIENGTYSAVPQEFIDPMCGNCLDPATKVTASTGITIKVKSLSLIGETVNAVLVTSAGYGIYIENSPMVRISNLTVTGGVRDQDGAATDAAIVVRNSNVEISDCIIRDNQGDFSETVAGIGGIMGREGAILTVSNNQIHDNSWDGVALYRGATAVILDNEIWNGRGAGVGITWDSTASVIRNDIFEYWKGIGSFGNTRVVVYNNFVHDLHGWGIVATGTSDMICRNNTVVRCGNVGIAGWSEEAKIEIVNNIIAFNGQIDQWVAPQVGIWMNCLEGNYKIAYNCIYGNTAAEVAFGYEEYDDGTWGYMEEQSFDGVEGNFYIDPMLLSEGYLLNSESPCIDSGDSGTLDLNRSRSDIGRTGGLFSNTAISDYQ